MKMIMNTTTKTDSTGNDYRIHIPKTLIHRAIQIAENSDSISARQVVLSALRIGLRRLEGGVQ
jgi:hypothetical protein